MVETDVVVDAGESRSMERVEDAVERMDGVEGLMPTSHRTRNGRPEEAGAGEPPDIAFRRSEGVWGVGVRLCAGDVVGRDVSVCRGIGAEENPVRSAAEGEDMKLDIAVGSLICSQ
jgi:hypothetical protein